MHGVVKQEKEDELYKSTPMSTAYQATTTSLHAGGDLRGSLIIGRQRYEKLRISDKGDRIRTLNKTFLCQAKKSHTDGLGICGVRRKQHPVVFENPWMDHFNYSTSDIWRGTINYEKKKRDYDSRLPSRTIDRIERHCVKTRHFHTIMIPRTWRGSSELRLEEN